MIAFLVRRLLSLIPMVAGLVTATFALLLLIPGDPAAVLLGQDATPDAIAAVRVTLGLDQPWPLRLLQYAQHLATGDLGVSIIQNQPIGALIAERLPATLELATCALFVAVLIGIPLGLLAAAFRGSPIDSAAMIFAQLGVSVPVYWLGILLGLAFAVELNWLPAIGRGPPLTTALAALFVLDPAPLREALAHLVLPAITLGANAAAVISRLVRASMLEVAGQDFVRTARAKGLGPLRVLLAHVLRNALLPIVSVIGLRFGVMLGSAVLTESIFGWPGLGQLSIAAISQRDIPLVQGIVLTFALTFALINLVVDLLYAWIDPRIRLA